MIAAIWTLVLAAGLAAGSPALGPPALGPPGSGRAAGGRAACDQPSPTQVNTTTILARLRAEMRVLRIDAYIITSGNDHQGEYIPAHDRRRAYVSGFSGSAGDAVVTKDAAALWTDSRYYLEAENQLDCNWQLIKTGEAGAQTIQDWLVEKLPMHSIVSADTKILTYAEWQLYDKHLNENNLTLQATIVNPVDFIWTEAEGRPPYVPDAPFVQPLQYAGESWQEKFIRVRKAMSDLGTELFVVTALDEIAWVLNLRGNDIPYSPFFRAYLIIGASEARLYLPISKQSDEVKAHLNADGNGLNSTQIFEYDTIWEHLQSLTTRGPKVLMPSRYSYALGVSYKIHEGVHSSAVKVDAVSPILYLRGRKSDHEAQGMRNAHIRDAVALCQFLHKLETGIKAGEEWDELKAVEELDALRAAQDLSKGPSFTTISAFGVNSALPHYSPDDVTNLVIDDTSMYMLDSGGQYLDGTTDVTRSLHFGTPTRAQREQYTALLRGCIHLASVKFPVGKTRDQLEVLIRAPLYALGLDYGHGSTHGIGFFGGVHEAFHSTYHVNFFGSQEPGYYLADQYGMRLENIVTIVEAEVTDGTQFLTFEPVTLVPYALNLIIVEELSLREVNWINNYYQKVRDVVAVEMERQQLHEARAWLLENTMPITLNSNMAPGVGVSTVAMMLPLALTMLATAVQNFS